jgi:hypothetical protein
VIRQRISLRTPLFAYLVRALTLLLALALVWYGAMIVLLAVKVAPHTVNSLSAYRTLFDDLANLKAHDFSTGRRLIVGFGGFLLFLIFLYLALQELPRPYLARGPVTLEEQEHGSTVVRPRAIERVAELAAKDDPEITSAAGRLGDRELNLDVGVRRATHAAETLTGTRERVRAALERHELPDLPVNVTLTGFDPKTRRELS